MTVRMLAAALTLGIAAAGVSAPVEPVAVRPVVFGAPLPLDPAAGLPSAGELTGILDRLADPNVDYQDKSPLVEGGIGPQEGHQLDHELHKAARHGAMPLGFSVANIAPAGPNAATADVTVSGPKLPVPITQNLTFVNQDGWKVSHDSVLALIEQATAV